MLRVSIPRQRATSSQLRAFPFFLLLASTPLLLRPSLLGLSLRTTGTKSCRDPPLVKVDQWGRMGREVPGSREL